MFETVERFATLPLHRSKQSKFHLRIFPPKIWSVLWWLYRCLCKRSIRCEAKQKCIGNNSNQWAASHRDKRNSKRMLTFLSLSETVANATWSRVLAGITPNSSDANNRKSSLLQSKINVSFIWFCWSIFRGITQNAPCWLSHSTGIAIIPAINSSLATSTN